MGFRVIILKEKLHMGHLDSSKVQEIVRKFFEAGNKQDLETLAFSSSQSHG
jgi:hypothetical protein